jgi:hypothetical protein
MRKEKDTNGEMKTKLVLLDHGLYETLNDKFKYSYATLWRGRLLIKNNFYLNY